MPRIPLRKSGFAFISSLSAVVLATAGFAPAVAQTSRPDLVFVLLDDMNTDMAQRMPRFQTELAGKGTTFENFLLSTPMCCPSRTNLLLGDFSHDHGVWEVPNSTYGGFQAFKALGHEEDVVAKPLQQLGYRTLLLGKFFNWYPHDGTSTPNFRYIPPYWNTWRAFRAAGNMFEYFGSVFVECDDCLPGNDQGTTVTTGDQVYSTDYLRQRAVEAIQGADPGTPLFLWLAPVAPHQAGSRDCDPGPPKQCYPVGPARYDSAFTEETWPDKPSLFEADLSDKPSWLQGLNPLDPVEERPKMDKYFRRALRSLAAVEDMLFGDGAGNPGVMTALQGRPNGAYVFVTSDNGLHFGEHHLPEGKRTFFEEDVRVPMWVVGPGVPAGRVLHHLVGNVDLARTFLELAGGNAAVNVDGRSLVPLLRPAAPGEERWRKVMLLEREQSNTPAYAPAPAQAVRTATHKYIIYHSTYPGGEEQLYDLLADENELDSRHDDPAEAARKAALAAALDNLSTCDGHRCRSWDGRDPEGEARRVAAALFNPCITVGSTCSATIVWDSRYFEKGYLWLRTDFGTTFRCVASGSVDFQDTWDFAGPVARLHIYDTDTPCGSSTPPPESDRIQTLEIPKAVESPPRAVAQIVALPTPCVPEPDANGGCGVTVFVKSHEIPATYDRLEVRLPNGTLWRSFSPNGVSCARTGSWNSEGAGRELSLYPADATVHCGALCDVSQPASGLGPRLDSTYMYAGVTVPLPARPEPPGPCSLPGS